VVSPCCGPARDPPICAGTAASVRSVRGAQNGIFCRVILGECGAKYGLQLSCAVQVASGVAAHTRAVHKFAAKRSLSQPNFGSETRPVAGSGTIPQANPATRTLGARTTRNPDCTHRDNPANRIPISQTLAIRPEYGQIGIFWRPCRAAARKGRDKSCQERGRPSSAWPGWC